MIVICFFPVEAVFEALLLLSWKSSNSRTHHCPPKSTLLVNVAPGEQIQDGFNGRLQCLWAASKGEVTQQRASKAYLFICSLINYLNHSINIHWASFSSACARCQVIQLWEWIGRSLIRWVLLAESQSSGAYRSRTPNLISDSRDSNIWTSLEEWIEGSQEMSKRSFR